MRALVQRVASARVLVGEEVVGAIGAGLCVFAGVTHGDDASSAGRMAERIFELRVFDDDEGLSNLSARQLGLELLVVSQFTLYADTSRGRRPSFAKAAPPDEAEPVVVALAEALRSLGAGVQTGRFRAAMRVELVNDGPFTLLLEQEPARRTGPTGG